MLYILYRILYMDHAVHISYIVCQLSPAVLMEIVKRKANGEDVGLDNLKDIQVTYM